MSNAKHTPGPWNIQVYTTSIHIEAGKNSRTICELDEKLSERMSNAKLIAAAPDMLAALLKWQNEYVPDDEAAHEKNNRLIEDMINAAIKKATE